MATDGLKSRKNWRVTNEERTAALAVFCPWCGARPAAWCERFAKGRQSKEAVANFVHPSRLEAARALAIAAGAEVGGWPV